jgi:prepilin-type N-terminal cleavage/methylation domain-containing protein
MSSGAMGNKQTGFTVLELIAVVVAIGIITAIAVPEFNAARKNFQTVGGICLGFGGGASL